MECPRCAASLTTSEDAGVEVDTCSGCRGIWLDSEELGTILEPVGPGAEPGEVMDEEPGEVPSGGRMLCPRCEDQHLVAYEYMGDSGVELDQCVVCEGIWLDGGERERIETIVARDRHLAASDARFEGQDRLSSSPVWRLLQLVGQAMASGRRLRRGM